MICYSLAEDQRITKTKILRINHWSPWQILLPKCSPTPTESKNSSSPQEAVFEKFFFPSRKGSGRGHYENTFTELYDQSSVFQPVKFLNLKVSQINFLINQSIVIDYTCVEIINQLQKYD